MDCYSLITLLLLFVASAQCYPKCCEEENFIINNTCLDGSRINIQEANCQISFVLTEDEYVITENNSLLLLGMQEVLFRSDQYCISKKYSNHEDIAIICEKDLPIHERSFILRAICGIFSVLFILLTIVVYLIVPQLRDLQGKCILHTLAGLGTAFFSLALLQLDIYIQHTGCVFMAFLTYSTFLLAFFWLNVLSFNVWKNIIKPNMWNKKDDFWYLSYCVYAYGMTSAFVIATLVTHHTEGDHVRPQFGEGSCFFNEATATWTYFYGPISILLVINLVLYTWSCFALWCSNQQNGPNIKGARYRCLMMMKLFFIMGLLWIFEVISYATQDKNEALNMLWVITDYINTTQGVLIFMVLVVFRKKALRGLAGNSCLGKRFPRSWQTLEDEECLEEDEDSKGLNA